MKCAPYAEYCGWKKRFGSTAARKLLDFQMKHLPTILDLARRENLTKAEAREVETVDVFMHQETWQKAKDMVEELKSDLPDIARGIEVWEAVDARKVMSPKNPLHAFRIDNHPTEIPSRRCLPRCYLLHCGHHVALSFGHLHLQSSSVPFSLFLQY